MDDALTAAPAKMPSARISPSPIGWIGTTTFGSALGVMLGTGLVAPMRPLSGWAGGVILVFVFGAVVGAAIGCSQALVIRRGGAARRAWIMATTLGWAAGFTVAAFIGEALGNIIDPTISVVVGGGAIQITSGAAVGLGMGLAQELVLRATLRTGRAWIIATAIGAGLGYGAATGVLEVLDVPILKENLVPSFGAIIGLFVGIAQALVLRLHRP